VNRTNNTRIAPLMAQRERTPFGAFVVHAAPWRSHPSGFYAIVKLSVDSAAMHIFDRARGRHRDRDEAGLKLFNPSSPPPVTKRFGSDERRSTGSEPYSRKRRLLRVVLRSQRRRQKRRSFRKTIAGLEAQSFGAP